MVLYKLATSNMFTRKLQCVELKNVYSEAMTDLFSAILVQNSDLSVGIFWFPTTHPSLPNKHRQESQAMTSIAASWLAWQGVGFPFPWAHSPPPPPRDYHLRDPFCELRDEQTCYPTAWPLSPNTFQFLALPLPACTIPWRQRHFFRQWITHTWQSTHTTLCLHQNYGLLQMTIPSAVCTFGVLKVLLITWKAHRQPTVLSRAHQKAVEGHQPTGPKVHLVFIRQRSHLSICYISRHSSFSLK